MKLSLVNKLVSGAKKDPEFFTVSRRREEKRKQKWQLVVDTAQRKLATGICKAADVQTMIK